MNTDEYIDLNEKLSAIEKTCNSMLSTMREELDALKEPEPWIPPAGCPVIDRAGQNYVSLGSIAHGQLCVKRGDNARTYIDFWKLPETIAIPHDGSDRNPVPDKDLLVKYRDGTKRLVLSDNLDWNWENDDGDVMEYVIGPDW